MEKKRRCTDDLSFWTSLHYVWLCDESPQADPHNPISCFVCSADPCCELRGGGMGQIAKTTVKISSESSQGVRAVQFTDETQAPADRIQRVTDPLKLKAHAGRKRGRG
jgi:hypothetical protein